MWERARHKPEVRKPWQGNYRQGMSYSYRDRDDSVLYMDRGNTQGNNNYLSKENSIHIAGIHPCYPPARFHLLQHLPEQVGRLR